MQRGFKMQNSEVSIKYNESNGSHETNESNGIQHSEY